MTIEGSTATGFEGVRDAFAANFADGSEVGAALAVHLHGEQVVDLWGGLADPDEHRPWQRDTLAPVFSTTKGATSACALLLVERGELDLDAPVADYWPEFAAEGKQAIPVRWLLTHQAGLPTLDRPLPARRRAGLAPDGRRAGRAAPVLDARHRARLPRADVRLARRRGGAAGVGTEPGHVLPDRDRRPARARLPHRPSPRRA